jgi:hypothetical protein
MSAPSFFCNQASAYLLTFARKGLRMDMGDPTKSNPAVQGSPQKPLLLGVSGYGAMGGFLVQRASLKLAMPFRATPGPVAGTNWCENRPANQPHGEGKQSPSELGPNHHPALRLPLRPIAPQLAVGGFVDGPRQVESQTGGGVIRQPASPPQQGGKSHGFRLWADFTEGRLTFWD